MKKLKRLLTIKILFSVLFLFVNIPGFAQTAIKVESVTITVSDLDNVLPFYTGILPFEMVDSFSLDKTIVQQLYGIDNPGSAVIMVKLQLGNEFIFLQEFKDNSGRLVPPDSRSNDMWFQHIAIVVTDMDKAYKILLDNRVKHVSTAPQKLPDYIPAAAGIEAFYFRDPDGHNLELIYFPPGKGNPKWNNPENKLFAGIDHTAIAISNTAKQTDFYENVIGLKTLGKSENFGPEQERLNQVFGARLHISGLVAQSGIGLEFLEYIAPPGGRPYPASSRPDDIWHWHTTIEVADIEEIYHIASLSYQIISENLVNIKESTLPYSLGFMVRDIDGHAILIVQK